MLAKELRASPVLLDDYSAGKVANAEGLGVMGSIGLLEAFYGRRSLNDLRSNFQELLTHNVYIDKRLRERRLQALTAAKREVQTKVVRMILLERTQTAIAGGGK